jgi:hypothetical protein
MPLVSEDSITQYDGEPRRHEPQDAITVLQGRLRRSFEVMFLVLVAPHFVVGVVLMLAGLSLLAIQVVNVLAGGDWSAMSLQGAWDATLGGTMADQWLVAPKRYQTVAAMLRELLDATPLWLGCILAGFPAFVAAMSPAKRS